MWGMSGFLARLGFKKKNTEQNAEPLRVGGVGKETTYEAAERTNLPLNMWMTRMMAQELPIMDSTSRQIVRDILNEYDGPQITTPEELPETIRKIMDL